MLASVLASSNISTRRTTPAFLRSRDSSPRSQSDTSQGGTECQMESRKGKVKARERHLVAGE